MREQKPKPDYSGQLAAATGILIMIGFAGLTKGLTFAFVVAVFLAIVFGGEAINSGNRR
jgi:hypothetical protein